MSSIPPSALGPGAPLKIGGERCGIWLLEDSPLEAEMARRALSSRHQVELFTEGSAVLERIANGQVPEALVLDWQLPGLSGVEVCRFLRSTRDEITLPVLMLTSFGNKTDILEALNAGANDYLIKPYDTTELLARVGTLVRTSRLHDAQLRRGRQLSLAADVGVALTQGGAPDRVLKTVAESIVKHLDVGLAALWVADAESLVLASTEGPLATPGLPERASLALDALGKLSSGNARWVSTDVAADERLRGEGWLLGSGARTFLGYPLTVGDQRVGVLVVLSTRAVLADAVDALEAVADVISLGLERARGERERVSLLARERSARQDAETANRVKDEFLATVSHELRTPLNAISGWTQMLLQGGLTPERTTRALQTIARNADSQTKLIDDLLDVSRIVSGQVHLDLADTDLLSVTELAVETLRPQADTKGVALHSSLANGDVTVRGDAARLQQVVWNLLTNAIKFTPAGGLVIVEARRRGELVELSVKDTGQGIGSDFLPHVFDRFRQADAGIARKHGGLGLGLSIVRHLVELHGGTIAVHSEGAGRGSDFVVTLPSRAIGRDFADDAPVLPENALGELVGLRVLVVDDQPDARGLLVTLLERSHAEVAQAGSAAEAMTLFRAAPPDLLISDVGMPEEDGLTFIRKIRALPPDQGGRVPALAVTAYTRLEDRTQAMMAGFDMHLAKPIQSAELLVLVAKLSGRLARA